jgi:hypothetical protein
MHGMWRGEKIIINDEFRGTEKESAVILEGTTGEEHIHAEVLRKRN